MVDLYWPRKTTYTTVTPSGPKTYSQGVHDVPPEKEERFRDRGWLDPDDVEDEVLLESEDADEDAGEDEDDEEEELSLDEDELSVTADDFDDEDDAEDEPEPDEGESGDEDDVSRAGQISAEAFVDRTPQQDVIDDIETGDFDDRLDEIEDAEKRTRDRRGVQNAIEERRS